MKSQERKNRIRETVHLLNAIRISMQQGGSFLVNRCAPNGPIMREPHLNYIHKASWGMYAAGVEHGLIARLLDWARDNALQPSGDFYFPGEAPEYRVTQRAYRPLNFLRVAVWIDHPLVRDERVMARIRQYQHKSGGVFNYIGDDPARIEEQPSIGALNTTFFGHLMIGLDRKEEAIKAGDWLCRFVQANRGYMSEQGVMYTNMTPGGMLITEIKPSERITSLVDNREAKQEFWQVGTAMAYLAVLYDVMRADWGRSAQEAQPYLDNALVLLDFEDTMPLYTYFWLSKCKVGWGAGELLRVLVKYNLGTEKQIEKAYCAAQNVAIYTFIDNQLPNGGWSCMHYPLSELAPEIVFDYKPLKGLVNVPDRPLPGSQTLFLPGEEITGEFLGEMKSIQMGLEALLARDRSLI